MDLKEIVSRVGRTPPEFRTEGVDLVSAVVVPLVRRGDDWHLVFEVRNRQLNRQPGEICFPGGGMEPSDPTPRDTAVRECCEELGLHADVVEILAPLDPFVSGSHVLVHPFLGKVPGDIGFVPDRQEIDDLFEVPLSYFLSTQPEIHHVEVRLKPLPGFPVHLVPSTYHSDWGRKKLAVYFYRCGPHTIWGLSARILVDLVERLQ